VFLATSIITVLGTTAETIMIMVLFGESWDKWELSFKIVTPILHIIFTMAQLHGSRILFQMYLKQKKLLAAEDMALRDVESNPVKNQRKKIDGEDEIKSIPSTGTTEVNPISDGERSPALSGDTATASSNSRKTSKFAWPWAPKRS
jgi:hypothetical protein